VSNDDDTKRAYDKKADAYAVLKKMLKNGKPPTSWDELFKEANDPKFSKKLKELI
jgi:toxin YhaV